MDKALDGFILEQILICKALLADIERRRPELSRPDHTPTLADAVDLQQLYSLRLTLKNLLNIVDQQRASVDCSSGRDSREAFDKGRSP
ncbi:hypothetical protein RTCIAT899_PC00725 (plasmid) [Rhizobium tropici CIAT 899]|nr:hypothetical protein RTCIAT899_PC00725 [Rhizobium tropici CIAT 899]TGF00822.1 hypothetical protein C9417_00105 [Rhizobium sp. SEMIA 4088]